MIGKTAPLERSFALLLQTSNRFFMAPRSAVADMQRHKCSNARTMKRENMARRESWATHLYLEASTALIGSWLATALREPAPSSCPQ